MLENPMYLADPPEPEHFDEKAHYEKSVDLKWSVWSLDRETWEERSPGAWDWMREWFEASTDPGNPELPDVTDAPRILHTAPRKEIRFGVVEFEPGVARVHFWAEWDCGRQFHVYATIESDTFGDVMHKIDHCEVDLLRDQHHAYHGKQDRLSSKRCMECNYPYASKTSKRLGECRQSEASS